VLTVYATTLIPKATAYMTAYDDSARYESQWRREMAEGKGAVAALVKVIRSWLPLLVRDIPQFDASTFADKPDVPDDVIEDAGRLIDLIEEIKGKDGQALPYKNVATQALTKDIAAANKEWSEAEAADAHYQKLLADTRSTGAVFDTELQAFRRTLAQVVGRSDKDYQKLRAERASQKDEDDDSAAPESPPPVEPAPANAKVPVAALTMDETK